MTGLAYYRRYMRDFEEGCHGLSWEQRGFYSAVVDEIYLVGGPVLIDWRVFARRASSNAALARRLLSELIVLGKLYVRDDGRVGNPRADREIQFAKTAIIENIEKSKVLPKHLPKHLPKELLKTQQNPRARDRRASSSTIDTNVSEPNGSSPLDLFPSAKALSVQKGDFEEFWKSYPKREGPNPKQPAKLVYDRLLAKGAKHELIMHALAAHRNEHPNPTRFVPHARTWLSQHRFEDERPQVEIDLWVAADDPRMGLYIEKYRCEHHGVAPQQTQHNGKNGYVIPQHYPEQIKPREQWQ
jgi:uncharacterized protein YdaU (DUF1376 family)